MKLHRFIGNFNLNKGKLRIDDEDLINQLKNVLRIEVGDRLILCDGRMKEAEATVTDAGKNSFEVEIKEVSENKTGSKYVGILYCAILKRENFELVVQKATEVGIREIVPIITERTVKLNLRADRLVKIIKEAAEQSGRGVMPILHESISFEEALKSVKNDINLFFDATGENLKGAPMEKDYRISAWVGPEGGWTEGELAEAKEAGFKIASLGPTVLRAETAAIVSSYLISNL